MQYIVAVSFSGSEREACGLFCRVIKDRHQLQNLLELKYLEVVRFVFTSTSKRGSVLAWSNAGAIIYIFFFIFSLIMKLGFVEACKSHI